MRLLSLEFVGTRGRDMLGTLIRDSGIDSITRIALFSASTRRIPQRIVR
jgi:hypothetical protein